MAPQPEIGKKHHLLHVGYGLIVAVLVLMALAINSEIDRHRIHKTAVYLDSRVTQQERENARQNEKLQLQEQKSSSQDKKLKQQRERILRQERAINRLDRLRRMDAHALLGLHNELAGRRVRDAQVKQRLDQLEKNNATARSVINTTPTGDHP
jgi:hypothetical protein